MAKRDRTLPLHPVVGDHIRLKAECMTAFMADAARAGYDFDPYAIRTVTRMDPFAPGGGSRLYVEGAPHMFTPRQVSLAWNTDEERIEMLRAHGWKQAKEGADWKLTK